MVAERRPSRPSPPGRPVVLGAHRTTAPLTPSLSLQPWLTDSRSSSSSQGSSYRVNQGCRPRLAVNRPQHDEDVIVPSQGCNRARDILIPCPPTFASTP